MEIIMGSRNSDEAYARVILNQIIAVCMVAESIEF